VPEIEMAINLYNDLQTNMAALKRFVEQQQALASQMMDVSHCLRTTYSSLKNAPECEHFG